MTVATLLLVIAPESARQMEPGLVEHQHVVSSDVVDSVILQMGKSPSVTILLEDERPTGATLATTWLVVKHASVRMMDRGLEMHQCVNDRVSVIKIISIISMSHNH